MLCALLRAQLRRLHLMRKVFNTTTLLRWILKLWRAVVGYSSIDHSCRETVIVVLFVHECFLECE
uniref:Uncharacterized protein n=1 Tax=Physcomitrium patens TaxID=3218 RepID=A0A2K1L877_PHYPA|nr:hypothetical protein PHYPA_000618 [Physcomitrium patens]